MSRRSSGIPKRKKGTSQAINGPLLEFLKRDICCGWGFVKVEAMLVFLLFVERGSELLLFVIDCGSPLGINTVEVRFDHLCCDEKAVQLVA